MPIETMDPKSATQDSGFDDEIVGTKEKRNMTRRHLNVPLLLASLVAAGVVGFGGSYWHAKQKEQIGDAFLSRASAFAEKEDWRRAIGYYQRYLWLNPEDMEVRLKLVDFTENAIDSFPDRFKFSSILYETIGLAPERHELRVRLAQNLLNLQDYGRALTEAETFLQSPGAEELPEQAVAARRVIALCESALSRQEGKVGIAQAADSLRVAVEESPADVELVAMAAEYHLHHQDELQSEDFDPTAYAFELLADLTDRKPDSPDAWVSSYLIKRKSNRDEITEEALEDLSKALSLDPQHYSSLIWSAREAAGKDEDKAIGFLRRAIEASPTVFLAYVDLAKVYQRKGEFPSAISVLRDGDNAVPGANLEIGKELVLSLLGDKQYDEAKVQLSRLDRELQNRMPSLSSENRKLVENELRILRGKLAQATLDVRRAIVELQAVVGTSALDGPETISASALEAQALLAGMMERMRVWDMAAYYWAGLAAKAPHYGEAYYHAGQAYIETHQPERAIGYFEDYLNPPGGVWTPNEEAWLFLMRAQLQKQLRRGPTLQNWSEFLAALAETKQRFPDRWEPLFAEIDYLQSLNDEAAPAKIFELLQSAEQRFADQPECIQGLILGYERLGRLDEAQRALELYESIESDPVARGETRASFLVRNNRFDEAFDLLTGLLSVADENQVRRVELMRVKTLLASHRDADASELIGELVTKYPEDAQILSAGIETALKAEDYVQAEEWENRLRQLDLPNDFVWQYFRARRMLANYADLSLENRAELGRLISTLRSARPSWHAAISLSGRLAELSNDPREAIENYRLAIKLGDDSATLTERLVSLLYAEGRYVEADEYLERLLTVQEVDSETETLAIKSALKKNQTGEAVRLAQDAVRRNPEDPLRQFWLANLLFMNQQPEESEAAYRDALKLFPNDLRLWNGLLSLLIAVEKQDAAEELLGDLTTQFKSDPYKQHFVLAQGFAKLGGADRARQECEAALQADAKSVECRLFYARLLLESNTTKAQAELETVLKLAPENGEARRQLALLWAAKGEQADITRAMELLKNSTAQSGVQLDADNRLRALLLAREGKSRSERERNLTNAHRILEEQIRKSDNPADVDRLLLAKIYEEKSLLVSDITLLQASREQFQALVERAAPNPSYVQQYVEFLLRQLDQRREAKTSSEWENVKDIFVRDAHRRLDFLEELLQKQSSLGETLELVGFRVQLDQVEGKLEEAERRIDAFVENKLPQLRSSVGEARSYLGVGNLYSIIGSHVKAETWFRKLEVLAPATYSLVVRELAAQGEIEQAIDLCLNASQKNTATPMEAAALMVQIVTGHPEAVEVERKVMPIVNETLQKNPDNIDLLLAVAVYNVTRENTADAIRLFQEVVGLAPSHSLALNNLATLLAESPETLPEAERYIRQAIELEGRKPALLDTLGTIQLQRGDLSGALASLEEAVAMNAPDARYYFHLAVAFERTEQSSSAAKALEEAMSRGLEKMILTSGDTQMLDHLRETLSLTEPAVQ